MPSVKKGEVSRSPILGGNKGIPPGMPGKPSVKKSEDSRSPALSRSSINLPGKGKGMSGGKLPPELNQAD